jgi:hypothetical protein
VPFEADAPLLVHANAVLTLAITLEGFQLIRDWNREILQGFCCVQLLQLHQASLLDIPGKLFGILTLPDLLGLLLLEGLDHVEAIVTPCVSNNKRYYVTVKIPTVGGIPRLNAEFHMSVDFDGAMIVSLFRGGGSIGFSLRPKTFSPGSSRVAAKPKRSLAGRRPGMRRARLRFAPEPDTRRS